MDFSVWQLIVEASLVVKLVMLLLLVSSLWSWFVIFQRCLVIKKAQRSMHKFEQQFWENDNIKHFYHELVTHNPSSKGMNYIFIQGFAEYEKLNQNTSHLLNSNLITGVQRALKVALFRESAYLNKGLTSLASIGSVSPYVGLFGTVWGIMHSFMGLSQSTTAVTIAVVAPGIAEALVATAMGLFAAIPATLFYNYFSDKVDGLLNEYETFTDEFLSIIHGELQLRK